MILIPIKNLANAKQRLSPVLTNDERQELARAMCADVLSTVAAWQFRSEVAVVTSDPFAVALAERFGFEVIRDDENPGETGAIEAITSDRYNSGTPAWTPDGKWLYFLSDRHLQSRFLCPMAQDAAPTLHSVHPPTSSHCILGTTAFCRTWRRRKPPDCPASF